MAEHLTILLAVGSDLLERVYTERKALASAEFADFNASDKIAKRFMDKFPTLIDTVKEKDGGYEAFMSGAPTLVERLGSYFTVLSQILEFRDHALVLIHEMSTHLVAFDFDVNRVTFIGYYRLMLTYVKLHLLVGLLAQPSGRGKLGLAAYARAHMAVHQGREPPKYQAVSQFMLDYEQPVLRLQDDMSKAKLRVADGLLPLAMRTLRLSDPSCLRAEAMLAPLGGVGAAGGAGGVSTKGGASTKDEGADVEPLLAHVGEARQWIIYGLLMCPEDLATEGAIDLLLSLLSGVYMLPLYGDDAIQPHAEFDMDTKTLTRWIKRKDEVRTAVGA